MPDETIGKREDDKAFLESVWCKFWHPETGDPVELSMEQMAKMNPRLALRFAYDAGMERGQEKRGCCHD